MPRGQNGWPASPSPSAIDIRPVSIAGVGFPGGIAHHDGAAVVLTHVFTQYHYRVEKLRKGWCWGYYYRANRNDPNSLSNHAPGTAGDCNAPLHPNGRPVSVNFSPKQVATIHDIIGEVNSTKYGRIVRWGGDYTRTIDAMHFEIVGSQEATLAVAKMILAGTIGKNISLPTKIIVTVKPGPSVKKARKAVMSATGASVVNVNAVTRVAAKNDDARDVQAVLNRWYPQHKIEVDGVWGDESYELLDFARKNFKIRQPVSDVNARRATLKKLGFITIN